MIEIRNLTKSYGKDENLFFALRDVSFKIEKGDIVAIVGKSGSGKSTLMHTMSGLDSADSGEVLIEGVNILKLKPTEIDKFRNKKIGFIFQQFHLQPRQTVLENVVLPLEIQGLSVKERNLKGMEALKAVNLEEKAKSRANDLSGGQKQRVCVARAIITKPEIIFADEPTGNLDSTNGDAIVNQLFELNKTLGATIFIVTHDHDLAAKCNTQIHIADGRIEKITTKNPENK
jgi:putative ABC transport system ATP-binding protein